MYLGNLLLVASTAVLAVAAPSTEKSKRASKFQWFGVNESGAEFGNGVLPGQLNKHYTWPPTSTVDTLIGRGMNAFRVPIMMERLIPTTMTGNLNYTYSQPMMQYLNYITSKGAYAILDPHNFGRYYGNVISDFSGFEAWWKTTAALFKDNDKIIFDCNNEPHDMGGVSTSRLMQACINGVRASGANSQYIFVEGTSWSGAWTWVSSGNGADLLSLSDPQNKIIYEMHQYLDSDGSGTSANCVSSTIGSERIKAATAWLKANNKKAILGEFAGGANTQCNNAVKDLLTYMGANADVWLGALWWGGGPWWGNYIFNMEPPSGTAYTQTLPLMLPLAEPCLDNGLEKRTKNSCRKS
ncbi:putative endo-beta-1,4-glucanase B [Amylocarpus encephaloides]|uniref:cellulase n=1 Tax=Amylocarpus encephaloides TaxID=45428 RepID=A0A9P7Y6P7_9HELO|nr:putative endo-beta-1,4-glucanase B [Amylocarpus encephaloides]